MSIAFEYVEDTCEKRELCDLILRDLPLWFGLPESNDEYCRGVIDKPFIRVVHDGSGIGFASLKRNNEFVLEIYVMGIRANYHGRGIGKKLIDEIKKYGKKNGYRYLEVKTLDESRESEEYRRTRLFYRNVGFIPFDVLMNEWGPDNPCLIMLMEL